MATQIPPIPNFGTCIHMAAAGGLDPSQLLRLFQQSEHSRLSLLYLLSRIQELAPLRQTIEALQTTKHGRALVASLSDAFKTCQNIDESTRFALKDAFSHITPSTVGDDDESAASVGESAASVVLVFLLKHANPSIVAHLLFFLNCSDCPLKQFPQVQGKSMPDFVSDDFLSRLDGGSPLRNLAEYASNPPPMKRKASDPEPFSPFADAAPKRPAKAVCIVNASNATFTEPTVPLVYGVLNDLYDRRHQGDLEVSLKNGVLRSAHSSVFSSSCYGLRKYEGEHGLNLSHIDADMFALFLRLVYGADPRHLGLLHAMLPGLFDIAQDFEAPAILLLLVDWARDSLDAFNDNREEPIGIEHLSNAQICDVILVWREAHKLCLSLDNKPLPDDCCTSPACVLQLSASKLLRSYAVSSSRNASSRLKNLMSDMKLTPDHRRTLLDQWQRNGAVDKHLLFA